MLTLWEAIQRRRSIRKFAPDDVPDEMIGQMLEAARLAPSAANRQPWKFLVIKYKETRKELRRICFGQRFIEEAPVAIICFGDLERNSREARRQRAQEFTDAGVVIEGPDRAAYSEYRARFTSSPTPPPDRGLTSVVPNCYIAITHLLLMATALGLGTCWVAGADETELKRFFGLPDNLVPVAVIALGYPAGEIPPQRPRLGLEEILIKLPQQIRPTPPH